MVLLISYPIVREPGWRPDTNYDQLPPRFQSLDDNFSVKTFTFPSEEQEELKILHSCNGLLLLGQYYYKNLCVWNLSTGFFRKIYEPCLRLQSKDSAIESTLYLINSGFGYVLASDDYKLVFIIPVLGDLLDVHIYSVRANIWRVITVPYSSWPGWDGEKGTFSNGAIHWVIGNRDETSDSVIYAFDFAKEEFCKLTLPPVLLLNEDGHNPTEITSVVHLGGYLCIWCRKLCDSTQGEVWAMEVYGMPESWVKLFQYDTLDFPDVSYITPYPSWMLCFITESGTMVIKMCEELFWIKCRNDERPICTRRCRLEEVHPELPGCSFCFDVIAYDETLVSVAS